MGVFNCSMFVVRYFISILVLQSSCWGRERELVALLNLSSWCLMMVDWLFLEVPWGCLRFVVFPDHTHYFFYIPNPKVIGHLVPEEILKVFFTKYGHGGHHGHVTRSICANVRSLMAAGGFGILLVRKSTIRNRYNQVPHLTRDTIFCLFDSLHPS